MLYSMRLLNNNDTSKILGPRERLGNPIARRTDPRWVIWWARNREACYSNLSDSTERTRPGATSARMCVGVGVGAKTRDRLRQPGGRREGGGGGREVKHKESKATDSEATEIRSVGKLSRTIASEDKRIEWVCYETMPISNNMSTIGEWEVCHADEML